MQADQNIIYKELGREAALLNTQTGDFFTLNESGKIIWKALVVEQLKVEQASLALCEEYDVDEKEAQGIVSSFIDDLKAQKLLK